MWQRRGSEGVREPFASTTHIQMARWEETGEKEKWGGNSGAGDGKGGGGKAPESRSKAQLTVGSGRVPSGEVGWSRVV